MLAGDELYLFDIKNGEEEASWNVIPVTGRTPGKRYGHTICFLKPYIVVFGGNTGTQPANDTWIISLDKTNLNWSKLELNEDNLPSPRLYHASGLCMQGNAQGMMIIFGGRDNTENPLSDTWGLRRHRDGRWDWVSAPYKNDPKPRYNVIQIIYYSIRWYLLVL
jgi:protein phosphatase